MENNSALFEGKITQMLYLWKLLLMNLCRRMQTTGLIRSSIVYVQEIGWQADGMA